MARNQTAASICLFSFSRKNNNQIVCVMLGHVTKTNPLWLMIAAALVVGIVLYRSRSLSRQPNVEPHAAEEIDKAKRR
jgi:hypothetical protein